MKFRIFPSNSTSRFHNVKRSRWLVVLMGLVCLAGTVEGQINPNLRNVILVENDQIYLDLGYNGGIREGMYFQIYGMNHGGKPVKLACMTITETFNRVSKGVLIEADIGVEVTVGDRVEILPELEHEETVDTNTESIVYPPPMKTTSRHWGWLTLGGGMVSSGLALHFRNATNDANVKYNEANNRFENAKTLADSERFQADIEKHRNDGDTFKQRYYIFAAVSIGLLGYAGYKLLLNRTPTDLEMNTVPPPMIFPEFSSEHIGFTLQRHW